MHRRLYFVVGCSSSSHIQCLQSCTCLEYLLRTWRREWNRRFSKQYVSMLGSGSSSMRFACDDSSSNFLTRTCSISADFMQIWRHVSRRRVFDHFCYGFMLDSGKFTAWSVFYWCCCSRAANCRLSLVYTLAYHAENMEHRVQTAWLDQKLVYYICYHLFLQFVYPSMSSRRFALCLISMKHFPGYRLWVRSARTTEPAVVLCRCKLEI